MQNSKTRLFGITLLTFFAVTGYSIHSQSAYRDPVHRVADDNQTRVVTYPPAPNTDPFQGPFATIGNEYRFAPTADNDILPGVTTEIWAKLYRPTNLGAGTHPLVILLHGNHDTCGQSESPIIEASCQYTFTGTCPTGQNVIQNHLGYEYIAYHLASWGYVVVSINSNRGINCNNTPQPSGDWGLNLARGRLVLKHLSLLSQWNTSGGTPASLGVNLKGHLDFSQVGLFGHSRGGEGVRAAYNLYNDSGSIWPGKIGPMTVRGIFEVGPVDGQTPRVLDAANTAWNVLLPMCDGDVVNLDGMKPFDRMLNDTAENPMKQKSMYAVWGANHNFYNTQWQVPEPGASCTGDMTPLWYSNEVGSGNERQTAVQSAVPFFKAYVGANRQIGQAEVFDPLVPVGNDITRIDRTFLLTPNSQTVLRMETFQNSNNTIGSLGQPHNISGITLVHSTVAEHDPSLKAGYIQWTSSGIGHFFQDNWTVQGQGMDLTGMATLDFRVSRAVGAINVEPSTDFHIQAVYSDGHLGQPLSLSQYVDLVGPFGSTNNPHRTLETVRIPLSQFATSGLQYIRGVRFTFDKTYSGLIFISDIDVSRYSAESQVAQLRSPIPWKWQQILNFNPEEGWDELFQGKPLSQITEYAKATPKVHALRPEGESRISKIERDEANSDWIKVTVESDELFHARDALPVLRLNGKEVGFGGVAAPGDLRSMIYWVHQDQLKDLPDEFDAEAGFREDPNGEARALGKLQKSIFP